MTELKAQTGTYGRDSLLKTFLAEVLLVQLQHLFLIDATNPVLQAETQETPDLFAGGRCTFSSAETEII